MTIRSLFVFCLMFISSAVASAADTAVIRINQMGYGRAASKIAVLGLMGRANVSAFSLIDAATRKEVLSGSTGKDFGRYGPFVQSYRLDFSAFNQPGKYYLTAGNAASPVFTISDTVYKGAADFALRYLRQQRCGYNPFLKDSCHTKDGVIVYGPEEGRRIDATGGWHDASDYLQYSTTSANATYHLLAAYRDFPQVFADNHQANGLGGANGIADVFDEGTWGLNWLLKMHPRPDWIFNQIADDRDHAGYRLPNRDTVDYGYGKANGRPVYFVTGDPQGLGKYKSRANGYASTAGKFASAFALASNLAPAADTALKKLYLEKALSAYDLGRKYPGAAQTAPNRAPYFYEEDNWADDMELAAAALRQVQQDSTLLRDGLHYASQETVTPWLGADTAKHYQWYPFHNFGHYELGKNNGGSVAALMASYYRDGIEKVWQKAKGNAFYRGVPFIWCSNNLTTSFAIQCYLYRQLTNDSSYRELENACFDWLLGCNPWGSSMICGLPAEGDAPADPHSSLHVLHRYPLDGGLVDGPVYGNIFNSLIGITLNDPDEYELFQSSLAVYHDDAGDFSTNEPTMDGTASLVYLLAAMEHQLSPALVTMDRGAIVRGDTASSKMAIVFTGDEYLEGLKHIRTALKQKNIKASFFLTGNAYRNRAVEKEIAALRKDGHYLGAHSDKHLLYADWSQRDSLLVTRDSFVNDVNNNFAALQKFGITKTGALYFLPPYEWYNGEVAEWAKSEGLQLINFTPGTRSAADYTTPDMGSRYIDSETILRSITQFEEQSSAGLNGFILLLHAGTSGKRKDKFYRRLPQLLGFLTERNYKPVRVDELLNR